MDKTSIAGITVVVLGLGTTMLSTSRFIYPKPFYKHFFFGGLLAALGGIGLIFSHMPK